MSTAPNRDGTDPADRRLRSPNAHTPRRPSDAIAGGGAMARLRLAMVTIVIAGCAATTTSTTAPPQTVAPPPATTPPTTPSVPTTVPRTSATAAEGPDSRCLRRAEFGDPRRSEYRLPYAVGDAHWVSQSYCDATNSHRNQLAYDFSMPIGTEVHAARSGVVKDTRADSPDDGQRYGEHNYVFIEHDDGTVAFYAHLMHDGVLVSVGDEVDAGDLIAYSGNSGQTGRNPHLHFEVYGDWRPREGRDVPVDFVNAGGDLDARGGLQDGHRYAALPID